MQTSSLDTPDLRGWLIKEKSKDNRGSYYHNRLPNRDNTNRRYFVVQHVQGGNNESKELALCYYKKSIPKKNVLEEMITEPCGWIFLSDVVSIEENAHQQRQFVLFHPSRIFRLSCLDDVQYFTWINGLKRLCLHAEIYKDGTMVSSQLPVIPRSPIIPQKQRRSLSTNDYHHIEKRIIDRDTMQAQLNFMRELTNNKTSDDGSILNKPYEANEEIIPTSSEENQLSHDDEDKINYDAHSITIDNNTNHNCDKESTATETSLVSKNDLDDEKQIDILAHEDNNDLSSCLFKPSKKSLIKKQKQVIRTSSSTSGMSQQQTKHTTNNNNNNQGLESTNARLNRIIGSRNNKECEDDSTITIMPCAEDEQPYSSNLMKDNNRNAATNQSLVIENHKISNEDYSLVEVLDDIDDYQEKKYDLKDLKSTILFDKKCILDIKPKFCGSNRDIIVSSLFSDVSTTTSTINDSSCSSNKESLHHHHSKNNILNNIIIDHDNNNCDDDDDDEDSLEIDLAKEKEMRATLTTISSSTVGASSSGPLQNKTKRSSLLSVHNNINNPINNNDDSIDNKSRENIKNSVISNNNTVITTGLLSPDKNFVTDDWDDDDDDDDISITKKTINNIYIVPPPVDSHMTIKPDEHFLEDDFDD